MNDVSRLVEAINGVQLSIGLGAFSVTMALLAIVVITWKFR